MNCLFCKRDFPEAVLEKHHLVPRARGGKGGDVLVRACPDCHGAIHQFFSVKELERGFASAEALLANDRFREMVKWIGKQDPGKRLKTKRPRDQRKRGRYR